MSYSLIRMTLHLELQAEDGIRDVERSRGLGDVYKRQIDDVLEEKRYRESYLKTNPKGVAIAWVVVAVIISVYRYLTI